MLKVDFDNKNGKCELRLGGNDSEVIMETIMVIKDVYTILERNGCGNKFKKLLRQFVNRRNSPIWSGELLEGDVITSYNAEDIISSFGGDQ